MAAFHFWLSSVLIATSSSTSRWLAFIVFYSFSARRYYALFLALVTEAFGIPEYAAVNVFILYLRGLSTMFGSPVGGQLLESSEEGRVHIRASRIGMEHF